MEPHPGCKIQGYKADGDPDKAANKQNWESSTEIHISWKSMIERTLMNSTKALVWLKRERALKLHLGINEHKRDGEVIFCNHPSNDETLENKFY